MSFLKKTFKVVSALALIGLVAFLVFGPGYVERSRNQVAEHAPYLISDRARALHESLVIGDWHADSLLWNRDLSTRGAYGQVDIPRLIEGNVAIQVFTAVTKSPAAQNYAGNDADAFDNITPLIMAQLWPMRTWTSLAERALYQAEKLSLVQMAVPESLKIIRTIDDLEEVLDRRAAGEKVVGGLLGIEGAHPLEGDMANLLRLESAGYRLIALQHFFDNELGGSLHGRSNAGLTEFGREVVAEVERRGLILDVAHSSEQTVEDVLGMVDMPIILSHSGMRSVCDVKRNIPVDLMQRIAATGGVIGIGYWQDVTCDNSPAGVARSILAATNELGGDAVSLGSDFDGSVATTFDTSELAAITQELLNLGMDDAQIRKVMGENMLRVIRSRLETRP
ncbi:MAG: membrane dipeptidase [Rhodobacteraceae bacterium]|nr:membrane dipeptidase [Paracoccaceae bacterium]